MNDVIKFLNNRKSVRVFTEQEILPKDKKQILNAAFQAPTAGNMMLYSIIDVTDQGVKDILAKTCDNQSFIAKAKLVLIFLADYKRFNDKFSQAVNGETVRSPQLGDFMLCCSDALIAAQNAVVAADSLGIGSCYIGDILEQAKTHIELFKLPKYTMPVGMLVFGYPTQQQQDRIKPVRFDEKFIVHENTYKELSDKELQAFMNDDSAEKLYRRKYISDFMQEMNDSTKELFEHFLGND